MTQQSASTSTLRQADANPEPGLPVALATDSSAKTSVVSAELRRSQVTFKTVVVATCAILVVGLSVWVLVTARFAVALTVLALLVAVAMDHIVKLFERHGVPRWLAIILVGLAILGTLTALALLIVPAAAEQATDLVKATPHLLDEVRGSRIFRAIDRVFHVKAELDNPSRRLAEMAKKELTPLLSLVGGVLTVVSGTIVIIFLALFMLVFGGQLLQRMVAESRAERRDTYRELIRKIHDAIGGYVSGLVVICSINAALTTTFLAINRTPFFLPLGLLSGMSSLVPYAGPVVAGVTVSAIALGAGGVGHGVAAAIYFILYGQLEGNVLGPLVFRRAVNANPLLVTLSILFLGEVAGLLGAVAAVPVLAIVQIVVGEILRLRRAGLMARSGDQPASGSEAVPPR
jgi:predicted PurR-regulated permease PerM